MVSFRPTVAVAALLFNSIASSHFSFTNLLYRVHWCNHPTPGPLGCGPPVCHKASTLRQCHDDGGGDGNPSGSSGSSKSTSSEGTSGSNSGRSSGSNSESNSGRSSGSDSGSNSGRSSGSNSGSDSGSNSGSGSSSYSSNNGNGEQNSANSMDYTGSNSNGYFDGEGYDGNSYMDYSDLASLCDQFGGCDSLYSYQCDDYQVCTYQQCDDDSSYGCVYTCDASGNCYQICAEGDDCGSEFMGYYQGYESYTSSTTSKNIEPVKSRWSNGRYIGLLLLLLSLLAFAVLVVASKNAKNNQDSNNNHPLKGSLGKRMKLFARLAPNNHGSQDATQYRRTKDDGTAAIPAQTV